jgi:hypothetical protein
LPAFSASPTGTIQPPAPSDAARLVLGPNGRGELSTAQPTLQLSLHECPEVVDGPMFFHGFRGFRQDLVSLRRRHLASPCVLDCRAYFLDRHACLPQRSGRTRQVNGPEDILPQRILRGRVTRHEGKHGE